MSKIQNIDVRFNATSNFAQVQAQLKGLEAQARSLGMVFKEAGYAKSPAIVDPMQWRVATKAVHEASRVYRDAASSSGLLTAQQIRATSAAEDYTKQLQKQKLTLADMRKHSNIMKQVYHDQLRYQRMTAQYWGTDEAGRAITDITIPKNVPQELNTTAQRMYFMGQMAKSAGTQVINMGKNMQWAGRQLTVGLTYPVTLFGAAAGMMAYKVEDAFGSINKVYDYSSEALKDQNVLIKEQDALRTRSMETAMNVAKEYGLTVEKTLQVEQQLAATGLTGSKLQSTTSEVSRVSALGDIDPEQTLQMVIALQNAFKGEAGTAQGLTDTLNYMNAASNATSLSLQDIAAATPRAAAGLAQLGVDSKQMVIMLVAMREAGIDAATGANALKSATARILNPAILEKATQIYNQAGATQINLADMANRANGNFFDFITLLGQAEAQTKGLTAQQRNSARAALFGTYQFNRLNAVITNVTDAQTKGNNQTAKAIALSKEGSAAWQKQAEVSQKAMMSTPAAQLRREWSQIQIQLAEVGKPFLEVAAAILHAGTGVLKFFNGLSRGAKIFAAIVTAIAALAGPVIMLGGLFFNLAGQFTKGVGGVMTGIGKLRGAFSLVNKEEQSSMRTAEAQNRVLKEQQGYTSTLTQEMIALSEAYKQATAQATAYAGAARMANPAATGFIGPQTQNVKGYQLTSKEQTYYSQTPARGADGRYQNRLDAARNAMARDYMNSMNLVARDATAIEKKTAAENRIRASMAGKLTAGNAAMAAMAASAGIMMVSSNKTLDSIAKWTMIGGLVVPAVIELVKYTQFAAKAAWSYAAAQGAAALAAGRAAKATAAEAGAGGVLRGVGATLKGGLTGLASSIGPGGLAVAGITAIAGGFYLIHKHQQAIYETEVAQQKAVSASMDKWVTSSGKTMRNFQTIRNLAVETGKASNTANWADSVKYYETGGGKATTGAYSSLEGDTKKSAYILDKFIDLQNRVGLSATAAGNEIKAMLVASGMSAEDAAAKVYKLVQTIGEVKNNDLQVKARLDLVNTSNVDTIKASAKSLGIAWGEAFSNASTDEQARSLISQVDIMGDAWDTIYAQLDKKGKEQMKVLGINSVNAYLKAIEDGKFLNPGMVSTKSGNPDELYQMAQDAKLLDAEFAKAVADSTGLGGNITTIADLMADLSIKSKAMNYDAAVQSAHDMLQQVSWATDANKSLAAEQALVYINAINTAQGYRTASTAAQALYNLVNKIPPVGKRAADEAENVGKAINSIPSRKSVTITVNQVGSIVQTAMSATQSMMADAAMSQFNANWDATMAQAQASQQAAQSRLERQQQAAQDAFDKRWEARKEAVQKFYDKQMEAIKRQIELEQKADQERQRLFENEKARLQALADMQNSNIDFNMQMNQGQLDEAAKTFNNASVKSANDQMDAEQKAAEARSEARIDALEKKNDRLEKQRDRELKQLQKMEERQRKHLERAQAARSAALQKEQEDYMNALQARRDADEASLEAKLELFKAFVPRNKRELDRWVQQVGLSWSDFGKDIVHQGKDWSSTIGTNLREQILLAGTKVMSDNLWEDVGKGITSKLVKGLGFKDITEFRTFVRTGKMSDSKAPAVHHGGGEIGRGSTGRGNIPRSHKGLHRSERMVLAQDGEYMVRKDMVPGHRRVLEAINAGTYKGYDGVGGVGALDNSTPDSGYGAVSGLIAGMATQMLKAGLAKTYKNAYAQAKAKADKGGGASGGGYVPGSGARTRPILGPVTNGLHDTSTAFPGVDFAGPIGTPVKAVMDGVITSSYDKRGYEPRRVVYGTNQQDGFKSYGRVITLRTDAGPSVLYAHLDRRSVQAGQRVKGGATVGYRGNTGYVISQSGNGAHLHFGATNNPYAWLRRGGKLRYDNTPVVAHKGETMLSARLTKRFEDNVAGESTTQYTVTVDLRGSSIKEDVDIEKAVNAAIDRRESRLGRKRTVR